MVHDNGERNSGAGTTGVLDKPRRAVPSDLVTVASIAVLAYAASNVLHEAIGHGGACLLTGSTPQSLTSVSFSCDTGGVAWAERAVSAGGTVVNLLAGGLAAWAYRRAGEASPAWRFFLWLFATLNLMQAFGYFLFSGVGRFGDWAGVMSGVRPEWMWRIGLAAVGGALYWFTTSGAFAALDGFIGGRPSDRFPVGKRLALISYASGAGLYCVSGLFNPGGAALLLVSAAAASLGGASGLAWGPQLMRNREGEAVGETPARIARDSRLIGAAAVAALIFILVLGPGIAFN